MHIATCLSTVSSAYSRLVCHIFIIKSKMEIATLILNGFHYFTGYCCYNTMSKVCTRYICLHLLDSKLVFYDKISTQRLIYVHSA